MNVHFWILVAILTSLCLLAMMNIILVCLHDNDDAVKNNPIIVLFNHEGIAIIETMAPTLNSETVKWWLLSICSKCSIYEWYMSVKKLRRVNWFWSVDHETREDSTDFDHLISNFDIWKVIYIDFNGVGPQKFFDISVFSIYKVRYIRVYLTWKSMGLHSGLDNTSIYTMYS